MVNGFDQRQANVEVKGGIVIYEKMSRNGEIVLHEKERILLSLRFIF